MEEYNENLAYEAYITQWRRNAKAQAQTSPFSDKHPRSSSYARQSGDFNNATSDWYNSSQRYGYPLHNHFLSYTAQNHKGMDL